MRLVIAGAALAASFTAAIAAPPLRNDVLVVTPNQVVDMADARVAQLKADLRLTTDQDKNWGGFQNALHDMAVARADRMTKLRDQRAAQATAQTNNAQANTAANTSTSAPVPATRDARDTRDPRLPNIADDLRAQADMFTARADEYRKFADASGPFYDGLDDGQRRRFLQFVQVNLLNEGAGGPPMGAPMGGMRRF